MQSHSKSKSDWNHNFIYKLQLTSFATTLNLCILTQAYPPYFNLRQILREKKTSKSEISSAEEQHNALGDKQVVSTEEGKTNVAMQEDSKNKEQGAGFKRMNISEL